MNEVTSDTLTKRLDRLERENRRLKIAGAFLVLALVAVGAMGQMIPRAVSKVVEAERFVLRDATGKIMAILGTEPGVPAPKLFLYDQNGKTRAMLSVLADGTPGLALFDQNGKGRAGLLLLASGAPGLGLHDQNGKNRLLLSVGADDTPGLALLDQNGKERARLTVVPDGSPSLGLFDQSGKVRAALGVLADGSPGLSLADLNDKERIGLRVGTNGPSLVLRDENLNNRAVLGHTALEATATGTVEQRPASSLVLSDRDGKVIWKVP